MSRSSGLVGGCFKLLIIPIIISVVAGIILFAVQMIAQRKPPLAIASTNGALTITNNTNQVLYIRVAYRQVDQTGSSYCYPNPTKASGGMDPQLWPSDTQTYPPKSCNTTANGYAVWAWDNSWNLIYQTEG